MSQAIKPTKLNILVVPLDWGLGHATRCIPIINALLNQGCSVLLAAEGKTKNLLQKEFPQLIFLPLQGYRITYAKNKRTLFFAILRQIPKIILAIKKEQAWLRRTVKKYDLDAVISDNRYGLHHPTISSVFITHQLNIKTSLGKRADAFLQKINYRYINRFCECWVPDAENENNLSGDLSHPQKFPAIPIKYIGPLSRFSKSGPEKDKNILIILSGPEPQRTILENILIGQLKEFRQPVILVRGLPESSLPIQVSDRVTVYDHLPATQLQKQMNEACFVISRCGYSTVMDLAILQKKSILIPTPGQPEQEYLAAHLMKNKFALCIQQQKFSLPAALDLASQFDYQFQDFRETFQLQETVNSFLTRVRKK